MAELIAAGTSQTGWTDFTVTQGAPRTLYLKSGSGNEPAPHGVDFVLAHKTPDARYCMIAVLNAGNISQLGTIGGAGDFGVMRLAAGKSCGMDIEGT